MYFDVIINVIWLIFVAGVLLTEIVSNMKAKLNNKLEKEMLLYSAVSTTKSLSKYRRISVFQTHALICWMWYSTYQCMCSESEAVFPPILTVYVNNYNSPSMSNTFVISHAPAISS